MGLTSLHVLPSADMAIFFENRWHLRYRDQSPIHLSNQATYYEIHHQNMASQRVVEGGCRPYDECDMDIKTLFFT